MAGRGWTPHLLKANAFLPIVPLCASVFSLRANSNLFLLLQREINRCFAYALSLPDASQAFALSNADILSLSDPCLGSCFARDTRGSRRPWVAVHPPASLERLRCDPQPAPAPVPRCRPEPDRRSALAGRCSLPRAAASRTHGAVTALPPRSGVAARPELRRGFEVSCAPRGQGSRQSGCGAALPLERRVGGWLGRRACFSLPSIERLNELNSRVRYKEGRRILCVDKPCHPLPLRDPHIQCRDDE